MTSKKPILITGSHRSGTTWVGKMISISPGIFYVGEPFNPNNDLGLNFDKWFQYISFENEYYYKKQIFNLISLNYDFIGKVKSIKTIKDIRNHASQYFHYLNNKFLESRILIKDPIAFFSAEWLAKTFDMDVIVMIRHPAAFVGSLKKAQKWNFDYNNFLKQPLLMKDHLSAFRNQIKHYSQKNPESIVESGICLWNIFYSVIKKYQEKHPEWIFLQHENLSLDPCDAFREIYQKLDIDYSEEIRETIYNYSHNAIEEDRNIHLQQIKRNSYSNILSWQTRLTKAEIDIIREKTYAVAKYFYSDQDWEMNI